MATLGNKRKLAAVSRETPESTRNSRAQNTLDPELAQDYISHVPEEIEGRVTKKLSKEFSRTESCILGALSKPDEFLLNAQVRTCSVAVPGTSRNSNSENRETTGDRSSDDPFPEVRYSSHHCGQLNSPEAEEYPHTNLVVTMPCNTGIISRLFFKKQKSQTRIGQDVCSLVLTPQGRLWKFIAGFSFAHRSHFKEYMRVDTKVGYIRTKKTKPQIPIHEDIS